MADQGAIEMIAFTKNGIGTARRTAVALRRAYSLSPEFPAEILFSECRIWAMGKAKEACAEDICLVTNSLAAWTQERWGECRALIFIGAAGIAVRAIAPQVRQKTTDPAVLVIDERGQFVISLLSGHIGGANDLARCIASGIGALPVITTATDVNGLFSVDQWAREQQLAIDSMGAAKEVSARLLAGETVGVYSRWPLKGDLPAGLVLCKDQCDPSQEAINKAAMPECGIAISERSEDGSRFPVTLQLIPKTVVLGMGCRRDIPAENVKKLAELALAQCGIHWRAVAAIASIDLKKDEAGLKELASAWKVPYLTYPAEQLRAVTVKSGAAEEARGACDCLSSSAFVQSVTGVDNVCERAALLAGQELFAAQKPFDKSYAPDTAGEAPPVFLAVKKMAQNGVTAAVAAASKNTALCWPRQAAVRADGPSFGSSAVD